MMNNMKERVLDWFVNGETGISSEAMASAICGIKPNRDWGRFGNHPSDPSDLGRCIKFLQRVPEARSHLDRVAKLSKVWARLIEHWDELEQAYSAATHTDEDWRKLYERMKALGC